MRREFSLGKQINFNRPANEGMRSDQHAKASFDFFAVFFFRRNTHRHRHLEGSSRKTRSNFVLYIHLSSLQAVKV